MRLTDRSQIPNLNGNNILHIVDVDDHTDSLEGSSYYGTIDQIVNYVTGATSGNTGNRDVYWVSGATGTNSLQRTNSGTLATGNYSIAEGFLTTASGQQSHSGGYQTTASGQYSFVHGFNSVATAASTIVLGANITGTTTNVLYTNNINIKQLGSGGGTTIKTVGIDSNGFLVDGMRVFQQAGIGQSSVTSISNISGISGGFENSMIVGNMATTIFTFNAAITTGGTDASVSFIPKNLTYNSTTVTPNFGLPAIGNVIDLVSGKNIGGVMTDGTNNRYIVTFNTTNSGNNTYHCTVTHYVN